MHKPTEPLKRAAALLVAVLLLTQSLSAAVPDRLRLSPAEQSWLKANSASLVVYYDSKLPPLEFRSAAGQYAGMSADLIKRLEAMLGVSFIKRPIDDWNQVMPALQSGECALIPTIIRTTGREEHVFFTNPYFSCPMVIIVRKSDRSRLSLAELSGKKVGAVSGYITERYLEDQALISDFKVVPVSDINDGLRKLTTGQIDAFIESLAAASYFMQHAEASKLKVAGRTAFIFDVTIGVSRQYPLLYSSIQKALDAIPESDLATMRKKWIPLSLDIGLSRETILLIKLAIIFAALLFVCLSAISFVLKRQLNLRVADLKQSEKKYRRLTENSPAVVFQFRMTSEGSYSFPYVSQTLRSVLGIDPAQAIKDASTLIERIHPDDRAGAREGLVNQPERPQPYHASFRLFKLDEQPLWVEAWATPERQPDGSLLWDGFFVDISERRLAEEALGRSEAKLRAFFDAMQDVIMVIDTAGRFIEVAPTATTLLYRPAEQFLGKLMAEVFPAELAESSLSCIRRALAEGTRLTFDYELNIAGRSTWFTASISPFTPASVLWVARDMTEREQLRAQLNQAQKLESIGRLAGGVAHDFNNMLSVIIGHSELIIEQLKPGDPLRAELDEIRKAAQRSTDLTRQLLTFARKQNVSPRLLDLNATVAGMLKMLRRLIGENIELNWQPSSNLAPVWMDPSQIDQILANLCVNARDAIGTKGAITIATAAASFDEASCATHSGSSPGAYVLLSVNDTGCGMDSQVLTSIFEPFFTTKEAGKGTGLGLATVYGIVKQNQGFIGVESAPGRGTTFTIYLPQAAAAPATSPAPESPEKAVRGSETILLVEDEIAILNMTKTMLTKLGYTVLAASSPNEALVLAEEADRIDLLVSDVIMPGINGRELLAKLLERRPGLKHLFMSGYTASVIDQHGVLAENEHFIQKPFSLKDLAVQVRTALDG